MGGMRRQLQTLQWHSCNGADWSPIWPPAGPTGFSTQQPPNPPSLRHHRHHPANLQRTTIPHRLQPGHGFDIGCRISLSLAFASDRACRIERYRGVGHLWRIVFQFLPFLRCSRVKKLQFSIWIKGHNQSMITFADLSPCPLCVTQGHNLNLSRVLKVIKLRD